METKELINTIADCAKKVRSALTPGFEEKVYKNAMFIELRDCGIYPNFSSIIYSLKIYSLQSKKELKSEDKYEGYEKNTNHFVRSISIVGVRTI